MDIKFTQTPNFTKNSGTKKIGFVIHGTLGSFKSAFDWLMTPPENRPDNSSSSSHYIIGRKEGEIVQIVKNEDIAWHAGYISNPNDRAKSALPKNTDGTFKNPNQSFIGIELAWGYDADGDGDIDADDRMVTEWQYKAVLEVIRASGIPFNPALILSHHEIASYKGDVMTFAVNEITKRMQPPAIVDTSKDRDNIKKQITDLLAKL